MLEALLVKMIIIILIKMLFDLKSIKYIPNYLIILKLLSFVINMTKIVSEYDQEIPQSQTADNPSAPRGRATQSSRDTRKTNKAKQPALSSPSILLQY